VPTVIQIDDVQPRSEDREEIRSLLNRLVGKPFLFFKVSYGDELTIHLGELVPYLSPKMKDHKKGAYIVALRASAWVLESGLEPGLLYTSGDRLTLRASSRVTTLDWEEIESRPIIRPRAIVIDIIFEATPAELILGLRFSDGSILMILPDRSADPKDDGEEPLTDWEVFMPRHRVLKAGPGPFWSYTDSRTPPKDETAA